MMLPVDVSIFPKEHQANLRDIVYNLADIERQLKAAHSKLVFSHRTRDSKTIDDNSFFTVEFFRLRIDAQNMYIKYLTENDLLKYVQENG